MLKELHVVQNIGEKEIACLLRLGLEIRTVAVIFLCFNLHVYDFRFLTIASQEICISEICKTGFF